MRKAFKIKGLDCANCAANLENTLKNIDGVDGVSIAFMTQRMVLEIEENNFEKVFREVLRITKKEEPGCEIIY